MQGPIRIASVIGTTMLLISVGPSAGEQMRGCVNPSGALRIIGSSESCRSNEAFVSWNSVGPSGAQGPVGPVGATGPQGPRGLAGERGGIGAQGVQGERGLAGPQGDRGDVGPEGPAGPQGPQGPAGTSAANTVMVQSTLTFVAPRGGQPATIDVTCPPAHTAVSGAHYFGNFDPVAPPVVLASYRTSLDTWQMIVYNPSTSITVGVQTAAYCAPTS